MTHKMPLRINSGKHSMDVLPSDDECIALSDLSNGPAYRENSKFYDRVHHHHSSSSSRRRKHYREHHERRYSEEDRDTACRTHMKRRGCDIVRAKRRRMKPVLTSSDDDCFEVTSREELKVALNIKDELMAESSMNRSTLLHKLKAIHSKSNVKSDQEDTAKKKSTAKKRCRNKARSRGVSVHVPVPVPADDDIGFDEQAINAAIADALFVDGNHLPIGDDDCVDEAVSLEEQELRLIALKSAVMKKHEARKKRQFVLSIRAYSPTDSLLTPLDEDGTCGGDGDADEMVNQIEVIDDTEDNNNMDISPASSPESNTACQPMDMDLVSSNDDDSQCPIVFASLPKDVFHAHPNNDNYVSWMYSMPLVQNENFHNFPITGNETFYNDDKNLALAAQVVDQIKQPLDTEPSEMVNCVTSMASEEENLLRARLIAGLNCTESKRKIADVLSPIGATPIFGAAEDGNQDESLEADCLRSLLLSSIKHKKSRSPAIANTADPAIAKTTDESLKNVNQSESSRSMMDLPNLPKITSNLKEAVKRLQSKNKATPHTEPSSHATKVNASNPEIALDFAKSTKPDSVSAETMQTMNSETPVTKPSSPIVAEDMSKNDANGMNESTTKQSTKLPQRIIARAAQTLSKFIATKEMASTSAKAITPIKKVINIEKNSVESTTATTET